MRTTLINYYQIVLMEKIGLVGGLIIRDMQIQMDMNHTRSIWRFRDWVIDALNDDKKFNEFIIEQLAGDLLIHQLINLLPLHFIETV